MVLSAALAVLFNPGPPLPFKPAITRRKVMPLTGVSQFLGEVRTPLACLLACLRVAAVAWLTLAFRCQFETTPPPERVVHKTRLDRKKKKLERRAANHKAKLAEAVANCASLPLSLAAAALWHCSHAAAAPDKPKEQIEGGNAYNTLFVSNMSYETDEDSLRREFDVYVCCHCAWRLLFLTCHSLLQLRPDCVVENRAGPKRKEPWLCVRRV